MFTLVNALLFSLDYYRKGHSVLLMLLCYVLPKRYYSVLVRGITACPNFVVIMAL